ncbi:MAG: RluA family pseudouridine synthase [Candidatus Paceibacterota bacterium]
MKDIPIIFEDSDILVLNKPAGLSVHGDGFNTEPTLADWLLKKYPALAEIGESMKDQKGIEIKKPGLVHRLDRDTSGVLLVAKNQPTFLFLKEQFKNHLASKTYRAILSGEMKGEVGQDQTISLPIGRSNRDPRQRVANIKAAGTLREATTIYRVLKTASGYTYVEANPKTGRTHQLRVHFKALNYPILCDALYAPKLACSDMMGRQALHAFSLSITLPNGELGCFSAPLPLDFQKTLDNLGLM